ncbi:MAG: HAMP domain-containing histidine kinase [Clostridia bacterium]|nr:HAMP domain-containing histidine kinase [Clostridia bacterium]
MKLTLKNLSDKITAVFVYLLLAELVVALFLATDCMVDYRFYGTDPGVYARQETFRIKTSDEFDTIEHYIYLHYSGADTSELQRLYQENASNVVFFADDENGTRLLDNIPEGGSFDPKTQAEYVNLRPFTICDPQGSIRHGTICFCLKKGLPASDSYRVANNLIGMAVAIRYPILVVLVLAIVFSIIVLGMIMSSISRKDPKNENATPERFVDKIPFDLLILAMITIVAFVTVLIVLTSVADIKQNDLVLWNAVILILALILASVVLLFCISLATRIKYGHVYRNTMIFKLICFVRKKRGKPNEGYFKTPFIGKVIITIVFILLLEVFITLFFLFQYKLHENQPLSEFKFAYFAVFQLVLVCIVGALSFMMIVNVHQLRKKSQDLAHGKLDEGDSAAAVLFGDFRAISNDFENIKDDMIRAMEEKNRSAEMRNELIANISHDIKTPLTSIINYADIVSSGGCTEEELKNYLGVIGHQSQKLNDLLQSLIDVSKLSTGQIKANFETLDISLYLSQLLDEFSYAFAEKELDLALHLPENSVQILCDSSMLWRVFQNLVNNICKYAMPASRVYVDVETQNGRAVISFKNTSAQEITLTSEQLLERFKRGDKARSSGGNGLGLSIAKSFTEAQNGTFELHVDGDLFKTVLTFAMPDSRQE